MEGGAITTCWRAVWLGCPPRFGKWSERVMERGSLPAFRGRMCSPARDALLHSLAEFEREAGADLAAVLRAELWTLVERYDRDKRKAGKLDFLDLLLGARRLIRDNAGVRRFLQTRFTHLFVDEFQDTDPLQAEILLLLSSADPEEADWRNVTPLPGKFFAVGDPKQSIYKFRRADVLLYREVRDSLVARGTGFVPVDQKLPLGEAASGLRERGVRAER